MVRLKSVEAVFVHDYHVGWAFTAFSSRFEMDIQAIYVDLWDATGIE